MIKALKEATMPRFAIILSTLLLLALPVYARPVAGVEVQETMSVGGKTLKLNGAGLRKKLFIKVYVGAMYLEEAAIIKAVSARAVHMVFLRSVDKAKILGAYKEGFENNSGDKMASLQAGLDKLGSVISDAKEGTEITVSYVPGKGTTVAVKGGGSVTIEGKEFADAMFLIWLGGKPADGGLKKDLLAGK
jgi:hypothetical protein